MAILGHSMGGKVLLELLRLLRDAPAPPATWPLPLPPADGHSPAPSSSKSPHPSAHPPPHQHHQRRAGTEARRSHALLPPQVRQVDGLRMGARGHRHRQASIALAPLPKPMSAQAWIVDSQPGVVPAEADAQTGVSQVLRAVQVRCAQRRLERGGAARRTASTCTWR